jgi:hypothetical protein
MSAMALLASADGLWRQAVRIVFKSNAVPVAEIGSRLVSGLQEPRDRTVGIICSAHGFVRQQEFVEFFAEVGATASRPLSQRERLMRYL